VAHDRGRRHQPAASALDVFGQLRTLTEQAGREPAEVEIEVWVSMGSGTEADWARETRFWKEAGCSHVTLTTNFNRRHHRRIPGRTAGDHLTALRRYHAAVADLLLDGEGPRVRIPVLRQRLRLSSGSIKISSSAAF
jgi:hypothetical protein